MAVEYEVGAGYVRDVEGMCAWRVEVTRTAGGKTHVRVLESAWVDDVLIGREDARFELIAAHVDAF